MKIFSTERLPSFATVSAAIVFLTFAVGGTVVSSFAARCVLLLENPLRPTLDEEFCFAWSWNGFAAALLGQIGFLNAWFWFWFWVRAFHRDPASDRFVGGSILFVTQILGFLLTTVLLEAVRDVGFAPKAAIAPSVTALAAVAMWIFACSVVASLGLWSFRRVRRSRVKEAGSLLL